MRYKAVQRWGWVPLTVCVLAICLLSACAPGATPAPLPTPTFWPTAVVPEKPIYVAERGTVVDSLTFSGRISPLREAELYFRADGRVLDVYVARGDSVETGQRLAELDVAALYRQVARAELNLTSAQSDLANAEIELSHNLARAQMNLELERIALSKLRDYDASVDLAVVQAELNQAILALHKAQASYDAVAHVPNIAMRPESEALQQATLAHARAQAAYDQATRQGAQRTFDIQSQQKRVELSQLEVERLQMGADPRLEQAVLKAELELEDLRAQITDTLILAPIDGEITALSTAAGKAVAGYQPVMVIADPTELEVSAELAPDDMRQLSEGQEATVVPIEFPGQELLGTVRSLPYPYGSGGSGSGLDEEDTMTHLAVDLGTLAVEPGDLVRVTIILERKDGVIWLPPAAIRTFEGRKFVLVQEGAGQRQVDVTLGIISDDRVEIEAGLEKGDVVLGY